MDRQVVLGVVAKRGIGVEPSGGQEVQRSVFGPRHDVGSLNNGTSPGSFQFFQTTLFFFQFLFGFAVGFAFLSGGTHCEGWERWRGAVMSAGKLLVLLCTVLYILAAIFVGNLNFFANKWKMNILFAK